jgi:hypothetical protein
MIPQHNSPVISAAGDDNRGGKNFKFIRMESPTILNFLNKIIRECKILGNCANVIDE